MVFLLVMKLEEIEYSMARTFPFSVCICFIKSPYECEGNLTKLKVFEKGDKPFRLFTCTIFVPFPLFSHHYRREVESFCQSFGERDAI